MPPFPADAVIGPGELLELVDRELRGTSDERVKKASSLLERALAFCDGEAGIPESAFASPVAQLHVGAAGPEGRRRLEVRLEQLRRGEAPLFQVHEGLLPHLELPPNARGWRALREHLAHTWGKRYAGDLTLVVPAARLQMRAMGNRFLEEVWVFAHPAGHWHYVTFGLTALVDDMPAAPAGADGWGFELTMRVAPSKGELGIPSWPVAVLHNLAAYVQNSRCRFDVHHHMSYGRAMSGDLPSQLRAVAFIEDPEVRHTVTPYGSAKFLQVLGLTDDEEAFTGEWSTSGLLDMLGQVNPLHIVHRARGSSLADPTFGPELRTRAAAEGSSLDVTFVEHLSIEADQVTLGPASHGVGLARNLAGVLRGRLGHARPFAVKQPGTDLRVRFEPGEHDEHARAGDELVVVRSVEGALGLAARLDDVSLTGSVIDHGLTFTFIDPD